MPHTSTARCGTALVGLFLAAPLLGCSKEQAPARENAPAPVVAAKAAAEPAQKRYVSHYGQFKVGDFVKLKSGETIQTREVTKVDDKTVHVSSTTVHGGQTLPGSTTPFERYQDFAPTPAGGGSKVGNETLTIAGKQVPCEVWELKRGKMAVKTWRSERLLGGVAKVLSGDGTDMKVTSEAVDFKSSE